MPKVKIKITKLILSLYIPIESKKRQSQMEAKLNLLDQITNSIIL
jgi:phenylpyruvate tautomerase PptA (4-oxalocrotonate tautomerase family)